MSGAVARVSVRILEREYQVACPPSERADLLRSAELLNQKMREIRDSGKVVGLDRIAVMAALNLTNELLQERTSGDRLDDDLVMRMKTLGDQIATALEDDKQLEL